MKSNITLKQLRNMKNDCAKGGCYYCDYKHDCDSYTDEDIMPPTCWMLPNSVDDETTLKTLTIIHNSCVKQTSCLSSPRCKYVDNTAYCKYRDRADGMEPCDWILPSCDADSSSPVTERTTEQVDLAETGKLVSLADVPTEDILKELERRQVSPEMMNQFAVERKAAQFKKEHLEIIKAAVTIHNYCENTAEVRENDCRSCFLYNRLKDGCGVNWSEKDLDENILELCKDGTII